MLMTLTNTSGVSKVFPVLQETIAAGASVTRGIKEVDLYKGTEQGNPEWKKLLDFQQRGWVTVSIVNDPNAGGPLPTDWFITAAHGARHQNGGPDEISVLGLSGLLADGQTPLAHAASHQNGGGDEISVAGLNGVLADAQTPIAHAASHLPAAADEFQSTAPTLTPAAEIADVINVAFESPIASVEQYMATVIPSTLMTPDTTLFILAETGVGAEVSPTARCRLIFTTDATGAAQLSVNDVVGASSETCYLVVEPLFVSADTASPCAPVMVAVTFDAV